MGRVILRLNKTTSDVVRLIKQPSTVLHPYWVGHVRIVSTRRRRSTRSETMSDQPVQDLDVFLAKMTGQHGCIRPN